MGVAGAGSNNRLYVVSNRNAWDIGNLKEEIAKRTGGVWFVGAVNVGKSSLLSSIWPEDGRPRPVSLEDAAEFDILPAEALESDEYEEYEPEYEPEPAPETREYKYGEYETVLPSEPSAPVVVPETIDQILAKVQTPKAPKKVILPRYNHVAPLVSDIPGTTAAPIRVSYKSVGRGGKYRGEVVDLPGLSRWVGFKDEGLMRYIRPGWRRDVIMLERVNAEQHTIKPGQSMIIGGLYMFTPKNCNEVVLVYPFTSLPVHVASTAKCHWFLASKDPENALRALLQDPVAVRMPPGVTERPVLSDEPDSQLETTSMSTGVNPVSLLFLTWHTTSIQPTPSRTISVPSTL